MVGQYGIKIKDKRMKAVNWNLPENDYVMMFWEQNLKQFWIDTEYIPSKDKKTWETLSPEMKLAYMKTLGGLTLLDTQQSQVGMPKIADCVESMQNKAVLSYMGMMEAIHAKSYSTIFTTIATTEEINNTFEWIEKQKNLQYKAEVITNYYNDLNLITEFTADRLNLIILFKGLVASVMLESFLFYSGFFLPLYLAGQGKMTASADIIKKIIADESIHGLFVGKIAQETLEEIKQNYGEELHQQMKDFVYDLLNKLYINEIDYIMEVYTDIGLVVEVKEFLKYNANKALNNLGFLAKFEDVEINQIVLNGLNLDTTQHDFFSKKSTNYEKATEIVHLKDEDFENLIFR